MNFCMKQEGRRCRRLISLLLCLCLAATVPASVSAEGYVTYDALPGDENFGFSYRFVTRNTVEITAYAGFESEVTVPSTLDGFTVVGIAGFAMSSGYTNINPMVKKVILPDTITYIGESAFAQSVDVFTTVYSALEEIVLNDGLKEIGNYAFENCFELKKIEIPASVTYIGERAFASCLSLDSITIHGDCSGYSSLAFGSKSGDFPAALANAHHAWLYDDKSSDFFIWNGWLFDYKGSSKTPVIPDGVKAIGGEAFSYSDITLVTLPASLTRIGYCAFSDCGSLTSVDIPAGVETIEYGAFSDCPELSSVTLHEGLESLGERAFDDCTKLTRITLPEGLVQLGDCAFGSCENLSQISFPKSLSEMTLSVIQDTAWYQSLPDGYELYCGSVFLGLVQNNYGDYPDTVTVRPGTKTVYLEYYCDGLNELILPDGLKTLYIQYPGDRCGITSLHVPESVDDIFIGPMVNLVSVTLPKEARLRDGTLSGCPKLKSVTLPKGNPRLCVLSDCDSLTSVTIPDDVAELSGGIGGMKLRSVDLGNIRALGQAVFKDCVLIESITLPDSLLSIGQEAFSGCSRLAVIKGGQNIKELGDYCFKDCVELYDLSTLEQSVTVINQNSLENTGWYYEKPSGPVYFGSNAYTYKGSMPKNTVLSLKEGTTAVTDGYIFDLLPLTPHNVANFSQENLVGVVLPASCKRVGIYAFSNCPNVRSIELGGTMLVDEMAFNNTSCETIVLPDSMRFVGNNAFSTPTLKSIHLNDGLRVLDQGAFFTYGYGKGVTIPDSVTYLGARCLGYYPLSPEDVFSDIVVIPDFVIYGTSGSTGEAYAEENGISFSTGGGCTSHTFVTETVEATCQSDGFTRKVCTGCGYTEQSSRTAATGHQQAANDAIDATCTAKGYTGGSHCARCGQQLSSPSQTAPLGHDWVVQPLNDPNATDYGYAKYRHYCRRCELRLYVDSPVLPSGGGNGNGGEDGGDGDVNRDGVVNASDALLVLKAAVGKAVLTDSETISGDMNRDGRLDATDALAILKKAVGK